MPSGAPKPANFVSPSAFRAWLRGNHRTATHLLVRIAKAGSAKAGITYAMALDEALCCGWIDGVRRRIDDECFSIRFSPRKPRSIWSRINVAHVERLIREGRMLKPGLAAFEARDEQRTGIYSFERQPAKLAPAYARAFRANVAAWKWYQAQAPWYRRTSTHWVMRAKREETRERRLAELIACSARGSPIGPLKRSP